MIDSTIHQAVVEDVRIDDGFGIIGGSHLQIASVKAAKVPWPRFAGWKGAAA